jgi:hypothetical protein
MCVVPFLNNFLCLLAIPGFSVCFRGGQNGVKWGLCWVVQRKHAVLSARGLEDSNAVIL